MTLLPSLLGLAGITETIWIDDEFSDSLLDRLSTEINSFVVVIDSAGVKVNHPAFAGYSYDLPDEIKEEVLRRILDTNQEDLPTIAEELARQAAELESRLSESTDISAGQFEYLCQRLSKVTKLCYKNWLQFDKGFLQYENPNILFLVDREFEKEGYGPEGDSILSEILSNNDFKGHCIMLTHTTDQSGTERLRKAIAANSNGTIANHRFAVMSKKELGLALKESEQRLASALRANFTIRCCYNLAREAIEVMRDSLQNSIDDLTSLSLHEIDKALFKNSLKDGSSELDVLTRILGLKQRIAYTEYVIGNASTFDRIEQIRKIREITDDFAKPVSEEDAGKLQSWRSIEILDSPEVINGMHSPLSNGDLFINTETESIYILLGQQCDISVRSDGDRSCDHSMFVKMVSTEAKEIGMAERYYEIPGLALRGKPFILDFRQSNPVNLNALDLVVYNSDGFAKFQKNQAIPHKLLPGWKRKFESLNNSIRLKRPIIPKYQYLSLGMMSLQTAKVNDEGLYCMNIQRIGKVRSPYSEAILGAFTAFSTRNAFEHDFSQ